MQKITTKRYGDVITVEELYARWNMSGTELIFFVNNKFLMPYFEIRRAEDYIICKTDDDFTLPEEDNPCYCFVPFIPAEKYSNYPKTKTSWGIDDKCDKNKTPCVVEDTVNINQDEMQDIDLYPFKNIIGDTLFFPKDTKDFVLAYISHIMAVQKAFFLLDNVYECERKYIYLIKGGSSIPEQPQEVTPQRGEQDAPRDEEEAAIQYHHFTYIADEAAWIEQVELLLRNNSPEKKEQGRCLLAFRMKVFDGLPTYSKNAKIKTVASLVRRKRSTTSDMIKKGEQLAIYLGLYAPIGHKK